MTFWTGCGAALGWHLAGPAVLFGIVMLCLIVWGVATAVDAVERRIRRWKRERMAGK